MRISMWSSYFIETSPEKMVKTMLEHGFNYTELSTEHAEVLLKRGAVAKIGKEFKSFCDNQGFCFPQGHFYLSANIAHPDLVERRRLLDELKSWCELFSILDIKAGVLHHGGNGWPANTEQHHIDEIIIKSLTVLDSYVDGTPTTICMENLPPPKDHRLAKTVENLLMLIESLDSNNFGICLDTGHLMLAKGNCVEFIKKAGANLKALHIADNKGVNDDHNFPYSGGTVQWEEVMSALKEINYQGLFNFEVPGERCPHPINLAKLDYAKKLGEWMCRDL